MEIKPRKLNPIRRLISTYGFLVALGVIGIYLLVVESENTHIIAFLMIIFTISNFAAILSAKIYRIVSQITFNDTDKEVVVHFFEYGFMQTTIKIPYSSLQYLLLVRRKFTPPPNAVRLYKNNKFVAEIQEFSANWNPHFFLTLVNKLAETGMKKSYE